MKKVWFAVSLLAVLVVGLEIAQIGVNSYFEWRIASKDVPITTLAERVEGLEVKTSHLSDYSAEFDERLEAYGRTGAVVPVSMFGVLRADREGKWFIQNDADHRPFGIDTHISQDETGINLWFSGIRLWRAGAIQISPDDDFGGKIEAYSNLGLTGARLVLVVDGQQISPSEVWDHVPYAGGGNFWITVNMLPAPESDAPDLGL